jgi:hypothetical protein
MIRWHSEIGCCACAQDVDVDVLLLQFTGSAPGRVSLGMERARGVVGGRHLGGTSSWHPHVDGGFDPAIVRSCKSPNAENPSAKMARHFHLGRGRSVPGYWRI